MYNVSLVIPRTKYLNRGRNYTNSKFIHVNFNDSEFDTDSNDEFYTDSLKDVISKFITGNPCSYTIGYLHDENQTINYNYVDGSDLEKKKKKVPFNYLVSLTITILSEYDELEIELRSVNNNVDMKIELSAITIIADPSDNPLEFIESKSDDLLIEDPSDEYELTFKPTYKDKATTYTIYVAQNTFTDVNGNSNGASNIITWLYVPPQE